jgi:hypothetical protein
MKRLLLILLLSIAPYLGFSQVWCPLGAGFQGGGPYSFTLLDKFYIGAYTSALCGTPFNGICTFDSCRVNSSAFGQGLTNGGVNDVAWYNGRLVAVGDFTGSPNVPFTVRIAAWDSLTGWSSLTPNGGIGNLVNCVESYNGSLYVGGGFVTINNTTVSRVAQYNGSTWSNMNTGVSGGMGTVYCMAVYHNQLYVGGHFYFAGSNNLSTNCIARWNGTQWDSVGSGMNLPVHSLVVDTVNDVLYAAGEFTNIGSTICRGVAVWNDTTWKPVGSGQDTLWGTRCLALFNGELYAGGANEGTTTTGDTIRNIYKFNGTKWVNVAGGANAFVFQLCVYDGNLYVGGGFTQVGNGMPANKIACFGSTCPTSVDIAEISPPVAFQLYPNPADDFLHIESNESQPLEFQLSDMNGKTVIEQTFQNKADISLKGLPAGTYLAHVSLKDGTRKGTQKIVVH